MRSGGLPPPLNRALGCGRLRLWRMPAQLGSLVALCVVSAPFAARGVQTARALYTNHRRTVLLGVALVIATALAVRMVGVRAPFLQHSDVGGQAFNTAKLDAPKGKPSGAGDAVKSGGEAIDVAPTASIAQAPAKPDGLDLAPPKGSSVARQGEGNAGFRGRGFGPNADPIAATRT